MARGAEPCNGRSPYGGHPHAGHRAPVGPGREAGLPRLHLLRSRRPGGPIHHLARCQSRALGPRARGAPGPDGRAPRQGARTCASGHQPRSPGDGARLGPEPRLRARGAIASPAGARARSPGSAWPPLPARRTGAARQIRDTHLGTGPEVGTHRSSALRRAGPEDCGAGLPGGRKLGGPGAASRPPRAPAGTARARPRCHRWRRGREGIQRRARSLTSQTRGKVRSHVWQLPRRAGARVHPRACANG